MMSKKTIFLCLFLLSFPLYVYGLQTQSMSWTGIDLSGLFFNAQNVEYDLNTQARYNISDSQYDETRSEGGLGYDINDHLSAWLGVTWIVKNADSDQERRVWEQLIWTPVNNSNINFSLRSRLEQRDNLDEAGIAEVFRERFQVMFPKWLDSRYTPVIYDEIFFNLNNPSWIGSQFVNQNRVFIGIQIPVIKSSNIQIGYLNRYRYSSPEDKMDNIAYVNLNIKT